MIFNGQASGGGFKAAMRAVATLTAGAMLWLSGPAAAFAKTPERVKPISRLKAKGLTDTPDAALTAKIDAKAAARAKKSMVDVRPLSEKEMRGITGRGHFRNAYFSGTLPWQRSFHDVNLNNGNLFKSFTDMQIAPGRGAGLVLQRTYNSNDDREGPFGTGWTHAYDIRMEEAGVDPDTEAEKVTRIDFFGGGHTYSRDADGLYTPPPYLYDELSSKYDQELANGPSAPTEDSQKGMDGTVKHFIDGGTNADGSVNHNERVCDSITDRHGNQTVLTYGLNATMADGSTKKMLTRVTDPVGRYITFAWNNLGTASAPVYRIAQVEGPFDPSAGRITGVTYRVNYLYNTDPSDAASYGNLHAVTLDPDGLNRTTTYAYTSFSDDYTDPATNTTTTETENGLLASITDPLGHSVSYTYDNHGENAYASGPQPSPTNTVWVTTITEPAGIDASGTPRTICRYIDPCLTPGSPYCVFYTYFGVLTYNYNIDTLQDVIVASDNHLRTVEISYGNPEYNGLSRRTMQYDSANNVTATFTGSYSWDKNIFTSAKLGHSGAESATVTGYDGHGSAIWQDAGSNALNSAYDTQVGPQQRVSTITYYDSSKYFQKATVTDALGHVTTMDYYDANDASPGNRGEVKWVRDAGYGDSSSPSYGKEFDYTYNAYGQKASETNLAGVVTQYTYGDSYGNLTQVVQDPGNAAAAYSGLNRTTSMMYDVAGHVVSSTDPNGQSSSFAYNTLGQPTSASFPAKTSGSGANQTVVTPAETVSYVYDTNGRTASVTDNRGTTSMGYENGSDRVHSVTDPITGTLTYTYLSDGERSSLTLPDGKTWTYSYYPLVPGGYKGRSSSDEDEQFYLPKMDDPNSLTMMPTLLTDDQGRRIDLTMLSGRMKRVYGDEAFDSSGNVAHYLMTKSVMSDEYISTTQDGEEANESYSGGAPANTLSKSLLLCLRTSWGWQQAAGSASGSGTPAQRGFFSASGGGGGGGGGTGTGGGSGSSTSQLLVLHENDYAYDNAGQRVANAIGHQAVSANGTPQITGMTTGSPNPVMVTDRQENYGYDNLSRLTSVNYGDGESQSYSFDAMGNRATKTDTVSGNNGGTTNETYAVDAANRLTSRSIGASSATVTSDANGNTLTDGKRTNVWDSENRLVSCTAGGSGSNGTGAGSTTSAFVYGSDGMRKRGTVTNADGTKTRTDYVYDASMLVEEIVQHFNASNSALDSPTIITYLQGAQGPLYRKASTEADPHWYLYDGLGSVVGEVDALGNVTASKLFDVYGATRGGSGSPTTRQGFVGGLGHQTDDETGLVYMRARYYDPGTGRFESEDPAKDGVNWFAYCSNNPINAVDESGCLPKGLASFVQTAGIATLFSWLLKIGFMYIKDGFANIAEGLDLSSEGFRERYVGDIVDGTGVMGLMFGAVAEDMGSLKQAIGGSTIRCGVLKVLIGSTALFDAAVLAYGGDDMATSVAQDIKQFF